MEARKLVCKVSVAKNVGCLKKVSCSAASITITKLSHICSIVGCDYFGKLKEAYCGFWKTMQSPLGRKMLGEWHPRRKNQSLWIYSPCSGLFFQVASRDCIVFQKPQYASFNFPK